MTYLDLQIHVAIPQFELAFEVSHLVDGTLVTQQYNRSLSGTELATHVGCPITVVIMGRDAIPETRQSGGAMYLQRLTVDITQSYPRSQPLLLPSLDGASFSVSDAPNQWNGTTARFQWTPQPAQAGASFTVCFRAADPCGWAAAARSCLILAVRKCRVCVAPGETMQTIAAAHSTDFLSLYATNVAVARPYHLPAGSLLHIGVTYAVRPGDDLPAIAARFLLSPAALLAANPDAARPAAGALVPGDGLCVPLPVCGARCGAGADCAVVEASLGGISSAVG